MPLAPQASLSPLSDVAREIANRLFARELAGTSDDAARVAAAERICLRVSEGLSRWFGTFGSRALIARALVRAQASHPALAAVTSADEPAPCLSGLAESARAHGAQAATDGVITLLAALADLIGRLIGDDLAASLLDQSAIVQPINGQAVAVGPPAPSVALDADPAPADSGSSAGPVPQAVRKP